MTLPPTPALVRGRVHHVRHRPTRYAFTHRHQQWLVDLDAGTGVPSPLCRLTDVRPCDHLDAPSTWSGLKERVLDLVAAQGVDTDGVTRVLLLAQARVAGHVFDPLSTYWLLDAHGGVRAAVLEVRNTYGGRHTYVLTPDDSGRADVDKEFFVSPFNEVSGRYAVRLTLDAGRVTTRVALRDEDGPLLTAATWGRPVPATTAAVLAGLVTAPFMAQRVSALIRWHGIRLWARRLPILTPQEVRR